MSDPLISIIMPSFNSSRLINKSIDSVIKQTYKNWELIIVDNFSSDNTEQIIQDYKNPNIIFYKNNNHGIVAHSRNIGIQYAKGSILAFLDSDDWWVETKLEKCVHYFKNGFDFVHHNLFIVNNINSDSEKHFKYRKLKSPIFYSLLFNGNAIINSSVMVRTELVLKVGGLDNNVELIASEDFDLWLKIALITDKFYRLPDTLGWYWQGDNNLSKNKDFSKAYNLISKKYFDLLSKKNIIKTNGYYFYLKGCNHFFKNESSHAFYAFLKSLMYSTWYIKLKSLYRIIILSYIITFKSKN
jgi:teichuronic acid biosynthesis glycosyltransferase TuaG